METAEESWKEHLATEEKKYVSWKKKIILCSILMFPIFLGWSLCFCYDDSFFSSNIGWLLYSYVHLCLLDSHQVYVCWYGADWTFWLFM